MVADLQETLGEAIPPLVGGEALALALLPLTGTKIYVGNYGDYVELQPTPAQAEALANFFIRQIRKSPGPIRMETGGIWARILVRQYWPWIVGGVGLGLLAGYALAPTRRRK